MCGLAGSISLASQDAHSNSLPFAVSGLEHRGPDGNGRRTVGDNSWRVDFAHCRLAIIDLSDKASQPMTTRDGRYTLVFNGEIYNYRELREALVGQGHLFETDSDSEVLLVAWAHWGTKALRRIIGMFAFAVHDSVNHSVTLVRDSFGIKPLYWKLEGDSFSFASEIPALLTMSNERSSANDVVLAGYLLTGTYDNSDATFFSRVSRLEPASMLVIDLTQANLEPKISRWWDPSVQESGVARLDEAAEHLRESFLESVRLHLRSDVPIGFALSGGIDSSAVVCAARYLEPDIELNTFSFVASGSSVDEEPWIDEVNRFVGAAPHKVHLGPSSLEQDLDDLIGAQGEPFGSTSIYAQYAVFRSARSSGVTVTLDGQGADELFAGYHGFVDRRLRSLLDEWKVISALGLLKNWSRWPGRSTLHAISSLASDYLHPSIIPHIRRAIGGKSHGLSLDWLEKDAAAFFRGAQTELSSTKSRRLVSKLKKEVISGELENLLRHGDRNSMRWSVESRVPFLTIPLAEAALGMREEHLLSSSGRTKNVLREALRGIVPDNVLNRRDKIGFETPERQWLTSLRTEIKDSWLDGLALLPLVKEDKVRKGITAQLDKGVLSSEAWRYLNASRWAMRFL